jgi:hypothetical protein
MILFLPILFFKFLIAWPTAWLDKQFLIKKFESRVKKSSKKEAYYYSVCKTKRISFFDYPFSFKSLGLYLKDKMYWASWMDDIMREHYKDEYTKILNEGEEDFKKIRDKELEEIEKRAKKKSNSKNTNQFLLRIIPAFKKIIAVCITLLISYLFAYLINICIIYFNPHGLLESLIFISKIAIGILNGYLI